MGIQYTRSYSDDRPLDLDLHVESFESGCPHRYREYALSIWLRHQRQLAVPRDLTEMFLGVQLSDLVEQLEYHMRSHHKIAGTIRAVPKGHCGGICSKNERE